MAYSRLPAKKKKAPLKGKKKFVTSREGRRLTIQAVGTATFCHQLHYYRGELEQPGVTGRALLDDLIEYNELDLERVQEVFVQAITPYQCKADEDCRAAVAYLVNGEHLCKNHMLEHLKSGAPATVVHSEPGERIPLKLEEPVPQELLPPKVVKEEDEDEEE